MMCAVTWFSVRPGFRNFMHLPVRRVADGADHAQAFLLVDVLDRARFHHRRHAVDPVDLLRP